MRAMNTIKNLAGLAAVAVFLAACSTPIKTTETPKDPVVVVPDGKGKDKKDVVTLDNRGPEGYDMQGNRSVYFDFDQYIVKSEFAPAVNSHAKKLSADKGKKILIQGNTDERGGREYNLALGQKRAEAVRKSLSLLGVPEAQMEAVSLGKEKPKATGSDEASWAENRRADIIYSGK